MEDIIIVHVKCLNTIDISLKKETKLLLIYTLICLLVCVMSLVQMFVFFPENMNDTVGPTAGPWRIFVIFTSILIMCGCRLIYINLYYKTLKNKK